MTSMSLKLVWSAGLEKKYKSAIKQAQNYIDNQCINLMTPYVPVAPARYRNSGKLRRSVRIKKAGTITYTAPHSKYAYYSTANHENGGNPRGKRRWFEVMKTKHKTEILRGVSTITRGKFR